MIPSCFDFTCVRSSSNYPDVAKIPEHLKSVVMDLIVSLAGYTLFKDEEI